MSGLMAQSQKGPSSGHLREPEGERGYIMAWSLIILVFAFIAITVLLSYMRTSLGLNNNDLENAEEYYAADAGVVAVLADLTQGVDILDPGYSAPPVVLNGKEVTISISAPAPGSGPPVQYRYFDPCSGGGLNPLPPHSHHIYQIDDVLAESSLQVNWAFAPTRRFWAITLYQGTGTGGPVVAESDGRRSPGYLIVDGALINGGTYTIDFYNASRSATESAPFSAIGGSEYTWVYTRAAEDYIVEAETGDTGISAYIRKELGPLLTVISWQVR